MINRVRWLGLLMGSLLPLSSAMVSAQPLQLLEGLPVMGPLGFQPSALSWCDGQLYTVSDKHNQTLFRLQHQGEYYEAKPHLNLQFASIDGPDVPWSVMWKRWLAEWEHGERYDWEGLSCAADGGFYLLSEDRLAVLQVDAQGQGQWLDINWYDAGIKKGLFQAFNAFAEGLVWHQGQLWLAAERGQRGLLVAQLQQQSGEVVRVEALDAPAPLTAQQVNGDESFSGLASDGQHLFSLERTRKGVCLRDTQSLQAQQCWSYEAVEDAPEWRYQSTHYAIAEGLAISDLHVFVIVDNNGKARQGDDADARPLVWQFQRPANWPASN